MYKIKIFLSFLTLSAAAGGVFSVFQHAPDTDQVSLAFPLHQEGMVLAATTEDTSAPSVSTPQADASFPAFFTPASFSLPLPYSLISWTKLEKGQYPVKSTKYTSGDLVIKDNGTIQLGHGSVTEMTLGRRIIGSEHLKTAAVNSRTIEDGSITGEDVSTRADLIVRSLVLTEGLAASSIAADTLDFTELKDALTLDASTDISVTGSHVFSLTNSGTGNSFVVNDEAGDASPFVIDGSGNVGIGTTSPTQRLVVDSGSTPQVADFMGTGSSYIQVTGGAAQNRWAGIGVTASGNSFVGTISSQDLDFRTGNTSKMTLTTGGNLGIGVAPNNLLSVYQLIDFNNSELNTKLGYQAGNNIAAGAVNNTFVGYQAGLSSATVSTNAADNNTAIGSSAFISNTTGSYNTASGQVALWSNTTGTGNSAFGRAALYSSTTGNLNTAHGRDALWSNTTGSNNTASGYQALLVDTTGSFNAAYGSLALADLNITLDNGSGNNTALGYNTGRGIVTGVNNTIIGANVTGLSAALSNNIIIADGAGNQRINVLSSGFVGIGDTSPSALFTVANGDLFQVNSSGAIAATVGVTTTGDLNMNNNSQITFNPSLAAGAGDTYLKINPPEAYTGDLAFEIKQLNANNNTGAPSTRNQVISWGFNIDAAEDSTRAGNWLSLEPDYRPGDGLYKEFHYVVSNPNASNAQTRLFSSTYVEGSTVANSVNTWDFRSSTFNFRNMAGTVYSVMQQGKFAWAGSDGTGFQFGGSGGAASINKSESSSGNQTLQFPSASWYLVHLGTNTLVGGGAEFDGDRPTLQVNGSQSTNGNIELFGSGRRITGDFSNATLANRTMFQNSTAHSSTQVGFIPNGNGIASVISLFARSDTTQTERLNFTSTSGGNYISTSALGAIAVPPLNFNTMSVAGGVSTTYGSLYPSGRWSFGNTTTDNGVDAVQVTGSLSATTSGTIPTLNGSTAANGDITVQGTSDATRTTSYVLLQPSAGSVGIGDTTPDALLDVKGTVCLDLNADDVCTDNTAALSDERLKDHVSDIENGLDLVNALRPVRFTWNGQNNTGTSDSLGFLAQDVEEIFPELVITDTAGYKNLDYSKLTAVLASAIQEQQEKITSVTLKTDTNITTLGDLQASVDEELLSVSGTFEEQEEALTDHEESIDTLASDFDTLFSHATSLASSVETLAEEISVLMDFYTAFEMGNFLSTDEAGNLELLGSLKAERVEASAFTIQVTDQEAPTIGQATIEEGETEVVVETGAVGEGSRILATPSRAIPFGITNREEGEGFTIEVPEAASGDISFDWWIVEEK